MALAKWMQEEIAKKVHSGQKLDVYTPEKQAFYDTYKKNIEKQVIDKAKSGQQLSNPSDWKSQLYNQNVKQATPNVNNAVGGVSAGTPTAPQFDMNGAIKQMQDQMQGYLNNMYDQQKQARLSQLRSSRDKAIGQINQQKAEVAPQYQGMRNQADVVNAQNVKRLRELMAANGLQASGENVSANAAMNNERVNSINSLNLQEQQTLNDFNRRITDLNNPDEENALMAALEADRSKALFDAYNRANDVGYGRYRDSVMDGRYADETTYNRGRDAVMDGRYNNEWDYKVGQDQWQRDYQTGRDKIEDSRWNQQWDYQKYRDAINDKQNADAIAWEKSKFASENAWRQYVYDNMSAGEKAQMEWNKQQFGEDMAWKIEESNRSDKLTRDGWEYQAGSQGFQAP